MKSVQDISLCTLVTAVAGAIIDVIDGKSGLVIVVKEEVTDMLPSLNGLSLLAVTMKISAYS